jgi:outer membrane protein OmpA-like peptidoglycan-associated protein
MKLKTKEQHMRLYNLRHILIISGLGVFSFGCLSIPDDAPQVFHEAKAKLNDARSEDVHRVFPQSYKTASTNLKEAVALYETTEDLNIPVETRAQNAILAKQKANEVIAITNKAQDLTKVFHGWDQTITDYAKDTQLQAQAMAFQQKIAYLNATVGEEKGGLVEITPTLPKSFEIAGPVAFFNFNQSKLVDDFKASIEQIASFVKQNPELKIKLIGYADPRGSRAYNKTLAYDRAQNVANALKNLGVSKDAIKIESEGAVDDVRRLSGESRYQLARRVEVIISA